MTLDGANEITVGIERTVNTGNFENFKIRIEANRQILKDEKPLMVIRNLQYEIDQELDRMIEEKKNTGIKGSSKPETNIF